MADPIGESVDIVMPSLAAEPAPVAGAETHAAPAGEPDTEAPGPAGIAPGLPLLPTGEIDPGISAPDAATAARVHLEIGRLNALAIKRLAATDYPAAIDVLRRVLNLTPDAPAAHGNLALALWRARRLPLAEIHCRRALALDASYLPAQRILAESLRERGAPEAIGCYRRLLALDPGNYMAHNNLGLLLSKMGCVAEADAAFDRALSLKPDEPNIRFNQLMARCDDAGLDEAVGCCRQVIERHAENADALTNLGVALQFMGRFDESLATYDHAVAAGPGHIPARFNRSLLLLLRGDYARGWSEYETRWGLSQISKPAFSQPEWQGEPLDGKTILLQAEQGFGDTIQFLRYVPAIAARSGRVMLRLDRPLVRLAASLPGKPVIVPTTARVPDFDIWCPLMSLSRILETRADAIPAEVPYLGVRAALAERWRRRLAGLPGLKIGLCWGGSPRHVNNFRRSIDPARLAPLFDLPGIDWVSLQTGTAALQIAALPAAKITDLAAELSDFAETAGAIRDLDLVITADTAVAHLAGALNRPAWVMLPFAPDWRWMLGRIDSPWYPSLKLYRQPAPGDWDNVVARVRNDLAALAATCDAPNARAAPGPVPAPADPAVPAGGAGPPVVHD